MAGDVSQGNVLIPLLLVAVLWAGVGTVPDARTEESRGQHPVVAARDTNSTKGGGSNGSGESNLDWLGKHWYVFVVLLVVLVVGCVFLCGCVVRKSQLGQYPLQMTVNGTHHSPHLHNHHAPFSGSPLSMRCSPQRSTYTDDAPSSVTQPTESSFMDIPSSVVSRGSLAVDPVPSGSPQSPLNPSPWAYIQSAARLKSRRGDGGRGGGGGGGGGGGRGGGGGGGELGRSGRKRRGHHSSGNSSGSDTSRQVDTYITGGHLPGHRNKRTASQDSSEGCGHHLRSYHHHRYTPNPLMRVSTTHDDGGASVCSAPSTVSMQSDNSNRSKSNRSSHSPSDASSQQTVVEVNVHLRLGKDQLDQAKSVTMAALAESARQLADSAADFGKEETYTRSLPHSPHPQSHRHLHPRHSISDTTTHPLPPASYLEQKHLFQSHSSSHLPPCGEIRSLRPASPRTGQTISLDKRSVRPYHPVPVPLLCAYATEDEGTVVSLDRHSSSSSCHCQSSVAMERGQRSLLSQSSLTAAGGGRVSTIVSLDQVSGGSTEQPSTVVSLDRASRPSLRDHRLWPEHKPSPSPLVTNHGSQQGSPSCADNRSGSPCNQTSSSNSSSCSASRAQLPLHLRHDSPRNTEGYSHPVQLNLDSRIEEVVPPVKYSPHAFYTLDSSPSRKGSNQQSTVAQFHSLQIPKTRQMNGYSYLHVPMHSLSHTHSRHTASRTEERVSVGQSASPKGPTYLHNISEQGESECHHSSHDTEQRPASMEKAKDGPHSEPTSDQLGAGQSRPQEQEVGTQRKTSEGRKGHKRKKERRSPPKESKKQRHVAASTGEHCPGQPAGQADEEKEEEEIEQTGHKASGQANSSGNLSEGRRLSFSQAHDTAENYRTCPSPTSSTETPPGSGVMFVSPPRLKKGKKPGKLTPVLPNPSLRQSERENHKVDPDLLSSQCGVQSTSSTLPHSPTSTRVSTSQSVQSLTDHSQQEVPTQFPPLSRQTSLPEVYPHGSPSAHPLDKTNSLPRTVSGLSVSEPLSSTGSGYVAMGESGSSLDATSTDENFHNMAANDSILCSDDPQLTYPLQRLLTQQYTPDHDLDIFDLSLDPQPQSPFQSIQSHSQPILSHSGSDSTHLGTHSIPFTYGRMEPVQQYQSVDV